MPAHLTARFEQDQHRFLARDRCLAAAKMVLRAAQSIMVSAPQVEDHAIRVGLGGVQRGLELGLRGEVELTREDEADRAPGFGSAADEEELRWRLRPDENWLGMRANRYGSRYRWTPWTGRQIQKSRLAADRPSRPQ